MATLQQDGGDGGQRVSEADHTHVIRVLLERSALVTPLETWQTWGLPSNTSTLMTTVVDLATGGSLILLTLLLTAHTIQHRQSGTTGATTILASDRATAALLLCAILPELDHSLQC